MSIKYLIDTNIAIYAIRRHVGIIRYMRQNTGRVAMSALVHSELLQGIDDQSDVIEDVEAFARAVPVIPYGVEASLAYGSIVQHTGFKRQHVLDRMIAAHAISLGATLVTNNLRDFEGVPGLVIENWAAPAL